MAFPAGVTVGSFGGLSSPSGASASAAVETDRASSASEARQSGTWSLRRLSPEQRRSAAELQELRKNVIGPLEESVKLFETSAAIRDGHIPPELSDCLGDLSRQMLASVNEFMETSKKRFLESSDHPRRSQPLVDEGAADGQEQQTRKKLSLSDIVHEFRTPLNNIQEALTKERSPLEAISILTASYNHLSALGSLLSKGEMTLTLEKRRFTIGEILSQAESLTCSIDSRVPVDFVCSDEVRNLPLLGDKTKLIQAFVNLISNAKKFAAEVDGGRVRIAIEGQNSEEDEISLQFSVLNPSKSGIPKAAQKKLFQRGSQSTQSAATTQKASSGWGLAISRDLVGLMGGQIHVDSNPEEGQTDVRFSFSLTLDKDDPAVEPLRSPSRLAEIGRGDSPPPADVAILIAEDESSILNSWRGVYTRYVKKPPEGLESVSWEVLAVKNGERALAAYEKADYDVVILDMHMGSALTGWDTAKKIMDVAKAKHRPLPRFVFCSAAEKPECLDEKDQYLAQAPFHGKPSPINKIVLWTIALGQESALAKIQRTLPEEGPPSSSSSDF